MLDIKKCTSLDEFDTFIKNKNVTKWEDLHFEIKVRLKNHIMVSEQTIKGISYCAYCEKKIDSKKSHIEHIKPRDKFKNETFSYKNLIVSCMAKESCGIKKENKYFTDFVSPVGNEPSTYFTYLENGEIYSSDMNAIETCEILNLNNNKLKQARQTIILQLQNIEHLDYYNDFPTLLQWIKEN
jgi:uncharacterized protein (TIGR02646 family)